MAEYNQKNKQIFLTESHSEQDSMALLSHNLHNNVYESYQDKIAAIERLQDYWDSLFQKNEMAYEVREPVSYTDLTLPTNREV